MNERYGILKKLRQAISEQMDLLDDVETQFGAELIWIDELMGDEVRKNNADNIKEIRDVKSS